MNRALTLAAAPLFLAAAALTTCAQPPDARAPSVAPSAPQAASASRPRSPLEASAEEIKYKHPDVPYDILFHDMKAVQASMSAIEFIFAERKQSLQEAERATLFGWKELRGEKLGKTTNLSPQTLINYVVGLGTLVIRSTPAGATIELDGRELADPTEMVTYTSSGTYRIRLRLKGYEAVEEECSVTEGKVTEFNKKLKPLPKKRGQP